MSLTPGQGRMAFALIVLAFAGLGAFLLVPRASGARTAGPPAHRAGARHAGRPPASARALPPVTPSAAAGKHSVSSPSGPPKPSATPKVDIYRLVPFSQSGLDRAVAVTTQFAADYATYSYRLTAPGYVATMRGLVTSRLAAVLARGYATPGVAQMRSRQKQVSTGTATVTGLRAFGPSSLTFVVKVVQRISAVQGATTLTGEYAVTVTVTGGRWRVNDIELASAGNS